VIPSIKQRLSVKGEAHENLLHINHIPGVLCDTATNMSFSVMVVNCSPPIVKYGEVKAGRKRGGQKKKHIVGKFGSSIQNRVKKVPLKGTETEPAKTD